MTKADKVWVWNNDQWQSAVVKSKNYFGYITVIFLDSLEQKEVREAQVVYKAEKPSKPFNIGGVKLNVTFERTISVDFSDKVDEAFIQKYFSKKSEENIEAITKAEWKVEYRVISVQGYDNSYICNYCQECSSDVNDINCKSCGKMNWVEWSEDEDYPVRYKVGDIITPEVY